MFVFIALSVFIDIRDRYWSLFWYIFYGSAPNQLYVNRTPEKRNFLTIPVCTKIDPLIGGTPISDHQLNLFVLLNGYNVYWHTPMTYDKTGPDSVPLIGWWSEWLGSSRFETLIDGENDWLRGWMGSSRLDWLKFHCRYYYVKSRLDGRRPASSTCTNEKLSPSYTTVRFPRAGWRN